MADKAAVLIGFKLACPLINPIFLALENLALIDQGIDNLLVYAPCLHKVGYRPVEIGRFRRQHHFAPRRFFGGIHDMSRLLASPTAQDRFYRFRFGALAKILHYKVDDIAFFLCGKAVEAPAVIEKRAPLKTYP